MATPAGTSNLKKPWAWLAAIAVFGLAVASSTALYVVNPAVKMPLPWWTAVVAPVLVYGLVLPLCVPRVRIGGWLIGFFTLAVLHVGIGLATAWLYARVGFTSFEQALAPALWGFPPALVLAMVGSLVMTLPFLGALAPRAAAPRSLVDAVPPRAGAAERPRQAPEIAPAKERQAWARGPGGAGPAPAESATVTRVTSAEPAAAAPGPAAEELPVVVPDEHAVHAAPLSGVNGAAPDMAEADELIAGSGDLPPAAVPDFRQALSELFGAPATGPVVDETLEAPDELVADEPSFAAAAAVEAPAASEAVVRVPFDRVMGQLPPAAFRVPLVQVGARLREAETLVVPQAVVVPQLGEGVVQVAWEVVAEQFPAAVFAVAPAEVKERLVNGRLLLPLDEIVRQLPPEVFAASIGREPVDVPGIESFPAPFKPLGGAVPTEPALAEPRSATAPAPPALPPAVPEIERSPEPEPVPVALEEPVQAPTIETRYAAEPQVGRLQPRGNAENLAALLAPWEAAALDEVRVGEFAIISVSAAGLAGSAVAAAAGHLSPVIARGAPRSVDQATLRGVGGTLVLTPVGSGWNTGAALAVGVRLGGPLARLEILARRAAAAHEPPSPAGSRQTAAQSVPQSVPQAVPMTARFAVAPPPPAAAAAAADLEAFGPLTAQSYREPASGALIHCFVPPGSSATELAPFAWELAQAMAQGPQAGPLGSFHSAVLRSGSERLEIRRLPSAAGPAPVLVVAGADTGRPGLARLQVGRAAARFSAV
jgi:hypothetical protein